MMWRRLHREQDGVSLSELMVTMGILTIVLGFVVQGFLTVQTATTSGALRLENLAEARILMDNVTKDVRTAARLGTTDSPFLVADDREVTFYANLNLTTACPKKIRRYVDARTKLIEQVTQPDAGGVPPLCTYTGAATNRLVGATSPTPRASRSSRTTTTTGPATWRSPSVTPFGASNRLQVNAVGIHLSIRKPTNYSMPYTTLVNRVRLPNVDYNPLPSPSP